MGKNLPCAAFVALGLVLAGVGVESASAGSASEVSAAAQLQEPIWGSAPASEAADPIWG